MGTFHCLITGYWFKKLQCNFIYFLLVWFLKLHVKTYPYIVCPSKDACFPLSFKYLFIYFWLWWVLLLLRLFSSCGKWGLLSSGSAWASHRGGFFCHGARALGAQASVVVARGCSSCGSRPQEHRLSSWCMGLAAPQHMGSSWIRDRTWVLCIGRRALYH